MLKIMKQNTDFIPLHLDADFSNSAAIGFSSDADSTTSSPGAVIYFKYVNNSQNRSFGDLIIRIKNSSNARAALNEITTFKYDSVINSVPVSMPKLKVDEIEILTANSISLKNNTSIIGTLDATSIATTGTMESATVKTNTITSDAAQITINKPISIGTLTATTVNTNTISAASGNITFNRPITTSQTVSTGALYPASIETSGTCSTGALTATSLKQLREMQ